MAVGRAPREVGKPVRDVADADRVAGARQQFDDGARPGRVAQVDPAEAGLDELVQAVLETDEGGIRSRREQARSPGTAARMGRPSLLVVAPRRPIGHMAGQRT